MFGSMILETAIGLIFTYLLLSLVCTSLNELLAGWRRWRGQTLKSGVDNLIGLALSDQLYKHPLVKGLSLPGALPSYIPSETFVLALLDNVTQGKDITSPNIKIRVSRSHARYAENHTPPAGGRRRRCHVFS